MIASVRRVATLALLFLAACAELGVVGDGTSVSIGKPSRGYLLDGARIPNSGDGFTTREVWIRRGARYGTDELVELVTGVARRMHARFKDVRIVVGDMSTRGGAGGDSFHRSHQSGRDADVAFYVTDIHGKPVPSTEYVAFDGDGRAKDGRPLLFDDERNWLLVESWARDRRAGLSHIFVSWPLRERLLKYARSRPKFAPYVLPATALLKQPEKGEAHDDHFHVRITCPKEEEEVCWSESKP
jgi:penicillin-insensitive murein endopeptidase